METTDVFLAMHQASGTPQSFNVSLVLLPMSIKTTNVSVHLKGLSSTLKASAFLASLLISSTPLLKLVNHALNTLIGTIQQTAVSAAQLDSPSILQS